MSRKQRFWYIGNKKNITKKEQKKQRGRNFDKRRHVSEAHTRKNTKKNNNMSKLRLKQTKKTYNHHPKKPSRNILWTPPPWDRHREPLNVLRVRSFRRKSHEKTMGGG